MVVEEHCLFSKLNMLKRCGEAYLATPIFPKTSKLGFPYRMEYLLELGS